MPVELETRVEFSVFRTKRLLEKTHLKVNPDPNMCLSTKNRCFNSLIKSVTSERCKKPLELCCRKTKYSFKWGMPEINDIFGEPVNICC